MVDYVRADKLMLNTPILIVVNDGDLKERLIDQNWKMRISTAVPAIANLLDAL